ncbi:MAG: signal peptidase I [Armatimonadota bacterium]|nr:signal peptidase I [Armatimonadota bacterium]
MSIIERCTGCATEIPSSRASIGRLLPSVAREAVKTVALTALVFLFTVSFIAQGYEVFGNCMDPNLRTGERLLGSKLAYRLHMPSRGDIVVFKCPANESQIYVKRVIGLPGELVEIRQGAVYVNGRRLRESYLIHAPHGSYGPSLIKPGRLFVMGDYRDCSNDSRYWGQLALSEVQAKAWVRYWPIKRAGFLGL